MKTPEEYFVEDVRLPDAGGEAQELSGAETAFLDKYLGVERDAVLARTKRLDPRGEDVVAGLAPAGASPAKEEGEALNAERMRSLAEIRLVSFLLMGREFALPISVIQEVIRYVPPTKLPEAPACIAGVVNLRGRVTPLVSLRELLAISGDAPDKFIVICRRREMQIGLVISAVSTMYKAAGADVEWNVEGNVGVHAQLLLGLYKHDDKLISILSIDNLIQAVLQGGRAIHA